jgi:hypothetical protein
MQVDRDIRTVQLRRERRQRRGVDDLMDGSGEPRQRGLPRWSRQDPAVAGERTCHRAQGRYRGQEIAEAEGSEDDEQRTIRHHGRARATSTVRGRGRAAMARAVRTP